MDVFNKYESVIIINPKLAEKEIKNTINKYKENLEKLSDQPVTVEDMGKKKLAYEIQKNKEGYYVVYQFYAKVSDISNIERNYRTDDNIMKFITVRTEQDLVYTESKNNEKDSHNFDWREEDNVYQALIKAEISNYLENENIELSKEEFNSLASKIDEDIGDTISQEVWESIQDQIQQLGLNNEESEEDER